MNGVKVVGHFNMPSRIAADASALYAKNLLNFLTPLITAEEGAAPRLELNWEDEILLASVLTHEGAVRHPAFSEAS